MVHPGLYIVVGATLFSVIMITIGVVALKKKSIIVSSAPFVVEYKGNESLAPAIVFIFFGSIFPLLLLSLLADKLFGIDYSMPIIFGIAAFVTVFFIISSLHRSPKKK